jgi:hypothetical protein
MPTSAASGEGESTTHISSLMCIADNPHRTPKHDHPSRPFSCHHSSFHHFSACAPRPAHFMLLQRILHYQIHITRVVWRLGSTKARSVANLKATSTTAKQHLAKVTSKCIVQPNTTLLDCILYMYLMQHLYDPGILPSSAN